jgi:hypothetical protein
MIYRVCFGSTVVCGKIINAIVETGISGGGSSLSS